MHRLFWIGKVNYGRLVELGKGILFVAEAAANKAFLLLTQNNG